MEGHEHRLNVLRDDLQSAKDKRITVLEQQLREKDQEIAKLREHVTGWKEGTEEACEQFKVRVAELEAELALSQTSLKISNENAESFHAQITHLRECLKRLEWIGPRMMCPICGNHSPDSSEASVPGYELYIGHASGCWLSQALKEGE